MKKLFLVLIFLFCLVPVCQAGRVSWIANPPEQNVIGYIVYFTDGVETYNYNAGDVTEVLDIETTFHFVPNVEYTMWCTAYNSGGESPASNTAIGMLSVSDVPEDNLPIIINRPTTITIIVE